MLSPALVREAMEEMVDAGLATHLGVSNFSVAQLEALLEHARVRPVANQVELHPLLAQRKLVGVCLRKVWRAATLTGVSVLAEAVVHVAACACKAVVDLAAQGVAASCCRGHALVM